MSNQTLLALFLMFAVAFGSYCLLWPAAPIITNDSHDYISLASDLAGGGAVAPHNRTIGYPLFLVLTGSGRHVGRSLFQITLLLHFGSVLLVVLMLSRLGPPPGLLLAVAAWMLLPLNVQSSAYVMTETLSEFLLVALIYCFVRWSDRFHPSWLFLGALLSTAAAMTRPAYQLLPPAIAVVAACIVRRHLRDLAAFALGASLLLGSIAWYNQAHFGYFGLTWTLGGNLCNRTALFVEDLPPSPLRDAIIAGRDRDLLSGSSHTAAQYQWDSWEDLKKAARVDSDIELAGMLARLNWQLIAHHPLHYLEAVVTAIAQSWLPYTTNVPGMNQPALKGVWAGLHAAVVTLFFLTLWTIGGTDILFTAAGKPGLRTYGIVVQMAFWLPVALLAYTVLIDSLFDTGDPRQRFPADFCMIVVLVLGAVVWRNPRPLFRTADLPQSSAGAGPSRLDQPCPDRVVNQIPDGVEVELEHNVTAVRLGGAHADP